MVSEYGDTSGSKANCGGHSGGRGPGAIGIVAIDRTGFHNCSSRRVTSGTGQATTQTHICGEEKKVYHI